MANKENRFAQKTRNPVLLTRNPACPFIRLPMSELPASGSPFPPGSSEIASAGFLLENGQKQLLTLRAFSYLATLERLRLHFDRFGLDDDRRVGFLPVLRFGGDGPRHVAGLEPQGNRQTNYNNGN